MFLRRPFLGRQNITQEGTNHAKTCFVYQVVFVASLDATLRQDRQLEGAQTRFLSTDEAGRAQCSTLGWQELEVRVLAWPQRNSRIRLPVVLILGGKIR